MAPTHETTASGAPIAASSPSRGPRNRLFFFHVTSFVHGAPAHQSGTVPLCETEVTSAPASTNLWQTRLPTKPVPPTTVTVGAPPPAIMAGGERRRGDSVSADASVDSARSISCGGVAISWRLAVPAYPGINALRPFAASRAN
eukprot:6290473-Prymnesium_polylepis.1